MYSLNTKILLAALCVAVFATPTLAQTRHRQAQDYNAIQNAPAEHYPNGAVKTGSAANRDSGAEFNLGS
ncbi:MAG: hypothetical protein WAK55_15040 [Xanthobacteraceae bacterium]|jgi:hypothetical protein